jgi:hypothetical protein
VNYNYIQSFFDKHSISHKNLEMYKNVIIFNRANEIEKFSCVIKFFLQTLAAQEISEIAKK